MLKSILVITRARLQIARNTFWRGKLSRKIALSLFLLVLLGGAFGLYTLMRVSVEALSSPSFKRMLERAAQDMPTLPTDPLPFLHALPGLALFFALAVLVVTGLSSVLSSLYLSGDLDMLLIAPIPIRAVFVVKFLEGLVTPYLLLFLLIGPALMGFGMGLGYGPAYYGMLLLILLLFPLLPTGLAAILVLVLIRFVPARRAREIVSVIGGLFGAAWYLASQFSRQITENISEAQALNNMRRADNLLLPSAWASRALIAAGEGLWSQLMLYGGLFTLASILIFGLCLILSEKLYYVGWSNMASQEGKGRKSRSGQASIDQADRPTAKAWWTGLLSPASAAILAKDMLLFRRDLRNTQRLIFPLALAGFWTYQLIQGRAIATQGSGVLSQGYSLSSAGLAYLVCVSLSQALGGPGISREGRAFWLLKTAPINAWQILLSKGLLAYLPFPLIGLPMTLLVTTLQQLDLLSILRAAMLLLLVGFGATSLQLGFGAAFPRLDWENPQQQTTTRAGCLTSLATISYFAVTLGLVLGLPVLAETFAASFIFVAQIVGWLAALVITLIVSWAILSFGVSRLELLEL